MLKREELRVGNFYLSQHGCEIEVTAIGSGRLLYLKETSSGLKDEYSTRIEYALENWTVAPPPKLKGKKFMNIMKFRTGDILGSTYSTREGADEAMKRLGSSVQVLACIEVDWTEGEGL